jgi:ribosomal protein L37AE/L43A
MYLWIHHVGPATTGKPAEERGVNMTHRCWHCGSELGKVRSSLTGIEYCLQCGAAVSGEQYELLEGEKTATENDIKSEVDDTSVDT